MPDSEGEKRKKFHVRQQNLAASRMRLVSDPQQRSQSFMSLAVIRSIKTFSDFFSMYNTSYKKLLLLLLLPSTFPPESNAHSCRTPGNIIETAQSPVRIKPPYEADSGVWTLNSAVGMPR